MVFTRVRSAVITQLMGPPQELCRNHPLAAGTHLGYHFRGQQLCVTAGHMLSSSPRGNTQERLSVSWSFSLIPCLITVIRWTKKIEGMTLPMVPNRIAFSERFGCLSDAFISCDFQWMQQWTESPMINMKTIISDMKQREHQGIFQPNVEANFISLCSTVSIDLRAVIMVYLWSTRHH